jgi:hypothetical protein
VTKGEKLGLVHHSKVVYNPFRRNFYTGKEMSPEQAIAKSLVGPKGALRPICYDE